MGSRHKNERMKHILTSILRKGAGTIPALFLSAVSGTVMLATVCGFAVPAPVNSPQDAYIAKYSAIAVEEMYRSGVPASITLAQGLLESNSGRSELAVKGNNHFGIKCHEWKGRKIYYDDDRKGECFRKYAHAEESFRDHSDFLRYRDRYKSLFDLKITDYKGWAYGLKKAGYATDPSYATKLIRLIEDYDLDRFDAGNRSADRKASRKAARKAREKRNMKEKDGLRSGWDDSRAESGIPQSPTVLEQPVPVSDGDRQEFRFSLTRQLYSQNGVPFIYSLEGETYASIASRYGLFLKEILRFNDASSDRKLLPGTMVYLQAKKNRAARQVDKHIVDGDETLRDIAQRYGVKMSSLVKMNGFEGGYQLREGDTVLLR